MTPTEILGTLAIGGVTVPVVYALERVRLLAGLHHRRRHPEQTGELLARAVENLDALMAAPACLQGSPPPPRPFWADTDRTELLRTVAEAHPTAPQAAPPGWLPPTTGWGGAGHGH